MRAQLTLASLFAVALLTGCLKTQILVPVAEAPHLKDGTVQTTRGTLESVQKPYSVFLAPNDREVLLRSAPRWEVVAAYPSRDALRSPLLEMTDALPIEGPVTAWINGENLELQGPSDHVIVPLRSVKELQITKISPGKTALLWSGLGTAGAVTLGVVIAMFATGTWQ